MLNIVYVLPLIIGNALIVMHDTNRHFDELCAVVVVSRACGFFLLGLCPFKHIVAFDVVCSFWLHADQPPHIYCHMRHSRQGGKKKVKASACISAFAISVIIRDDHKARNDLLGFD